MAINATNPVTVDGVEYPHYAVQLVVSPQIGAAIGAIYATLAQYIAAKGL